MMRSHEISQLIILTNFLHKNILMFCIYYLKAFANIF